MRGISREVLARDAAWSLAEGNCKGMAARWGRWERNYLTAEAVDDRARVLIAPAEVCAGCPIVAECADLAELSEYTGIAGGRAYRNGREDTYRLRDPHKPRRRTA
ncbi:hypothetical protein [uncultured Ornithinimicrobium sp.]|uniref:hypothetical protein n=1 Tax=uncultured Ornithinimicrobium sp. TaxID=259307 RepID=UPI002594F52B|nr:hypothetical protein [uncultured Ornithinimicrobium sp.]